MPRRCWVQQSYGKVEHSASSLGWWKIPESERDGNASHKSTKALRNAFTHQLALVHPIGPLRKILLPRRGRKKRSDLAMAGATDNSSAFTCATKLGYWHGSRLCQACREGFARSANSRCVECHDNGMGITMYLFIFGILGWFWVTLW